LENKRIYLVRTYFSTNEINLSSEITVQFSFVLGVHKATKLNWKCQLSCLARAVISEWTGRFGSDDFGLFHKV